MFFGKVVSKGNPFHFNDEHLEPNASHTLMITNAVLAHQTK